MATQPGLEELRLVKAPTRRGSAGFSLLEVMMGAILLSTTFAVAIRFSVSHRSGLNRSDRLTEATTFGFGRIEREKVRYDVLANFLPILNLPSGSANVTTASDVGKILYTETITASRFSMADSLIKIKVRVNWGASDSIVLSVLKVRP